MKLFVFIFILVFSLGVFAQDQEDNPCLAGKSQPVLNSSDVTCLKDQMVKAVEIAIDEAGDQTFPQGEAPYEPKAMFDELYDMAQDMLVLGYANLETFKTFAVEYETLYGLSINDPQHAVPVDANGDGVQDVDPDTGEAMSKAPDPKAFWRARYGEMFDKYFANIQNAPQECGGEGIEAAAKMCCQPLKKLTYFGPATDGGKTSGEDCSKTENGRDIADHDVCASKVCLSILFEDPSGNDKIVRQCAAMKRCFRELNTGEACHPVENPLCVGSKCLLQNSNTTGLNECKMDGQTCSGPDAAGNSECCSGKCSVNKKCTVNFNCMNCVKAGKKPQSGQTCCPGYYLQQSSGECRTNLMPLVPIIQSSIKFFIDQIFPSAHAFEPSERTDGQEEYLDRARSDCYSRFGNDPNALRDCIADVESTSGGNFDRDNTPTLTIEQQSQIDQMRNECTARETTGSQEHEECMARVDAEEKKLIEQNGRNGIVGEALTDEQLIRDKKAPLVTGKTYSNPDKCEFYSFNDNWRDASPMEQNAEVFLRGFEFTFSNLGTQDYWVDPEKNYQNIFSRANKVAKKFRENRGRMILELREIDRKMSCKCLAIFGPDQFDADRQKFFNESCEEERALLATNLTTDAGKDANSGGQQKDVARTSMNNIEDDRDTKEKEYEEKDKGAIGISHERLLIEWLGLRRDAQLARFIDNSELEEELNELSEFISGTDFNEAWVDELRDDRIFVPHQPPGDTTVIYRWWYSQLRGWVLVVVAIIAIALIPVSGGSSSTLFGTIMAGAGGGFLGGLAAVAVVGVAGSIVGGTATSLINGSSGGVLLDSRAQSAIASYRGVMTSYGGGEYFPQIKQSKKVKKKTFKKYYHFTRYYLGPKYNNMSPNTETKCDIYASSSGCFKSSYSLPMNNMKYLEHLNGEIHFVIDPKLPLFVDPNKLSLDKLHAYPQTWPDVMNNIRRETLTYLFKTAPGGRPNPVIGTLDNGGTDHRCIDSTSKNCGNKTKAKFGKRDVLKEAMEEGTFTAMGSGFNVVEFDNTYKKAIKVAAKKYALCKSFRGAGAPVTSDEDTPAQNPQPTDAPASRRGGDGESPRSLNPEGEGISVAGSPSRAEVSLAEDCGLPEMEDYDMGFGELYETEVEAEKFADYVMEMHYLYSSLTATTDMGYPLMGQEAYFAMVAYNMKLVGSFAATRTNQYAQAYNLYVADWEQRVGEYTALGEGANGTQSVNIKYSQAFYDLFGRFEFNGQDNIDAFDQEMANAQAGGNKFSKAELKALGAARNKALRTNNDLKKQKDFLADTKNLPGQELRVERQANQIAKNMSPIQQLNAAEYGGFGFSKLNKALGQINKNISSLANRRRSTTPTPQAARNPFVMPKFGGMPKMPTSSRSSTSNVAKDQGMSTEQASALINRLKRDENLSTVSEDDTLFTIVSKAYKRNYSRVLVRNRLKKNTVTVEAPQLEATNINDAKKKELKQLLED